MFPWKFSLPVGSMFSELSAKSIFKYWLKKYLRDFINGDIDLAQLDLQLSGGTLRLDDVSLNVDYLNKRLGGTPVIVKEGSIKSISFKIRWKTLNIEIEVEELELVLGPFPGGILDEASQDCSSDIGGKTPVPSKGSGKPDCRTPNGNTGSAYRETLNEVMDFAKMVQRLLLGLHVNVKNLIVAFESSFEKVGMISQHQNILVLRVSEIEDGMFVSEDLITDSDSRHGISSQPIELVKSVKFQGATLELLQTGDVENLSAYTASSFESLPFSNPLPILIGENGGFGGTLKLSIPWQSGSLDIPKLDADLFMDPIEIKFQPSSLKCIIAFWESFNLIKKDAGCHVTYRAGNSVGSKSSSDRDAFNQCSGVTAVNIFTPSSENSSSCMHSQIYQDMSLLPGTHLIADWVQQGFKTNQRDGAESEADLGASIDQFFECYDALRSSQATLSSNGIWNLTCSFFSAVTAASSLASGSIHIPSEQPQIETSIRANLSSVSIVISLHEEPHYNNTVSGLGTAQNVHFANYNGYSTNSGLLPKLDGLDSGSRHSFTTSVNPEEHLTLSTQDPSGNHVHHIEVKFMDIIVGFQICDKKTTFKARINQFEVDGYFSGEDQLKSNNLSIQCLQAIVYDALPPFPLSFSFPTSGKVVTESSVVKDGKTSPQSNKGSPLVKVNLLRSETSHTCQASVDLVHKVDGLGTSTSFSLKLPLFIVWMNLDMVNTLIGFSKQVESFFKVNTVSILKPSNGTQDSFSCDGQPRSRHGAYTAVDSPNGSLDGRIFLPYARIILNVPSLTCGELEHFSMTENFLSIDFSPCAKTHKPGNVNHNQHGSSSNRIPYMPSSSLHLDMDKLDAYLISFPRNNLKNSDRPILVSGKVFSATTDDQSCISLLWREGPGTGPWIAKRVWEKANLSELRRRKKMNAKAYEFTSVKTAGDVEGVDCQVRQEMILSSSSFLHMCLSHFQINLSGSEYKLLGHLLKLVTDVFSSERNLPDVAEPYGISTERHPSPANAKVFQSSVIIESAVVDVSVRLEEFIDIKDTLRRELPGSWNNLKLRVEQFELLSVSNLGGTPDDNFLWMSHNEGELWGSICGTDDEASDEDLILISSRNSSVRRGDGKGANALASGFTGLSVTHLKYSKMLQSLTSITFRCGTIVAPGGRVDWVLAILSIFSSSTEHNESDGCDRMQKGSPEDTTAYGSSFSLELSDVALCYKPYLRNLNHKYGISISTSDDPFKYVEESGDPVVACVLAAASLILSNETRPGSTADEYNICIQDIGLLLHELSLNENDGVVSYDVGYLRSNGFVQVAGETLIKAIIEVDREDGSWVVECSDCHIKLGTCHDTTSGLIRLVAQLQQLYAPDIEESMVHLQTRWDSVKKSNGENAMVNDINGTSEPPDDGSAGCRSNPVGLLDGILEDVFRCGANRSPPKNSNALSKSPFTCSGVGIGDLQLNKSMPDFALENIHISQHKACFPQIIEDYYLSDLLHASQSSSGSQIFIEESVTPISTTSGNFENEKFGWYEDSSLTIRDNHLSRASDHLSGKQTAEAFSLSGPIEAAQPSVCPKPKGRSILKNTAVTWGIHAGSDWSPGMGGRDVTICLHLMLSGLDIIYDVFPDGETCMSKLSVSIQDFDIHDVSKNAPWKKLLGYYDSKAHPRKSYAKAFKLELEAVKPDPATPLEEYRLQLALLPLRLHLDQVQLDFLIEFFAKKDSSVEQSRTIPNEPLGPNTYSMKNGNWQNIIVEALLPFFQKCDIWPVVVRVDYVPRRVDLVALRGGNYAELLNLVSWKGIDLQLKHVHAVGLYGWASVCETVFGEWLEDISHNQVHKLLKGLAPLRSLVKVGSGAAKLVSLPIKNYKKDHRLLKGMQRGAIAFLRSISMEAVGLGVHLAAGAHEILLQTEYVLTSIPPSLSLAPKGSTETNVRANQPKDAQEGIRQAFESLTHGLGRTASALVGTPLKAYQRGAGAGTALVGAVRAAPSAIVAPVSAAACAAHCALLGMRNSLDPELKKESIEKYSGVPRPRESRQ
ncbi:autophagy-related protein 2 isoform X1 [Amborella trichopoda]|uniref:Autophagy-related protein 2 n=1 Tax=Amborella trichopoda TaxID=13333 RepID=W1NQQ3_AMBTC|nr:autophagy-related protein 2 isoform X1 [Amborella trichopoda]ERM97144.1 hypothetical protein AMTR_s00126p00106330 [Amborella trichopoda]|eukprot:XP_006829728.1 autophagy-related protein 2 isoform X1 [Amborella trichopoda]